MNNVKSAPAYSPLWKKLYSLIQEFIRAEPWELLSDSDLFIVQSPRDYQMYLCCVMGNGGEEFGLNAFRGAQGMRNFEKIYTVDGNGLSDRELVYEVDMLSFTLSPRDSLEKKDLTVTKKLMLTFPGGKWPLIRSYRPHYIPWFLTEFEIEALCDCLQQTLEIYSWGEEAIDEIHDVTPGQILVRCMENSSWNTRKVNVAFPRKDDPPEIEPDDITTQRVLNLPDTGLKEEIELIHMPGVIYDHVPPYFGLLLLGVNERRIAQEYGTLQPFDDYFQQSCENLLQTFITRGEKPVTVVLKSASLFGDVFEEVSEKVGIHCERADELPLIDDFQKKLEQAMTGGDIFEDS